MGFRANLSREMQSKFNTSPNEKYFDLKVSDIISNEDDQNIYLYKEGIFWRAYEYSAYAFVKNIRQYNVKKKFFKIMDKEVVYLGFPDGALEQVLDLCAKKGLK